MKARFTSVAAAELKEAMEFYESARAGLGLLVIKSKACVVPVRVFGTFEAYGRHHKFPRPRRITVKYGPPLDFAVLRAEAESCSKLRLKEIYQQIADEIMTAIGKLQPVADDSEQDRSVCS